MALKARLETLDEIDEGVAALYRQEDGAYVLDVEPVDGWSLEDVGGLRNALKTERQSAKDATTALSKYKLDDGEFLDPETATKAIADVAELSKIDPETEAAKLAERKISEARTLINAEWKAKEESWHKRETTLVSAASKLAVNTDVDLAIGHTEVRGIPKILKPILLPHVGVRETEEGFRTYVKDPANPNEARMGNDGKDMTLLQLAQELKKDREMQGAFLPPEKTGEPPRPPHNPRRVGDDDDNVTGAARIARGLAKLQGA